jgi:hypothetical protein
MIALDRVGPDVVQERRLMRARRTCSNQPRIGAEQLLEGGLVAGDDRLHRRFKLPDRRARLIALLDVFRQRRPILETVPAGDDCLCVRGGKRGASEFGFRDVVSVVCPSPTR